jgi:hypothetical protein
MEANMSRKLRIMVSTAALLLPVLGILIWYYMPRAEPSLGKILEQMGYVELSPPSRLFPPGTITTVERLPNGSSRLHLACTIEEDALKPFWAISSTIDRTARWKIENALKASSQALRAVISTATGNRINNVNMALQNMTIVSISNENMIKVRRDYLKDSCEEAVIWNLRANSAVCQVVEVLQADLYLGILGEESIILDQRLSVTDNIAAEIGQSAATTSKNEIRGRGLYFGVRVNLYCFKLEEEQVVGTIPPNRS